MSSLSTTSTILGVAHELVAHELLVDSNLDKSLGNLLQKRQEHWIYYPKILLQPNIYEVL